MLLMKRLVSHADAGSLQNLAHAGVQAVPEGRTVLQVLVLLVHALDLMSDCAAHCLPRVLHALLCLMDHT